jgi:predicted aminopeptidase
LKRIADGHRRRYGDLSRRGKSAARLAALLLAALAPTGPRASDEPAPAPGSMSLLAYYGQSIAGHLDLMQRARPVADWLADPATPGPLRERLQLAQRLRDFAVRALALPDNASYRRYADLQRPAVVWNVVAAPELSLTLKTWCYPLMGCVGYRGYFKRDDAEAEAAVQRAAGLDASVYGVPAYSTLGWTNWVGGDPLLNTFVAGSEAGLARLVFHELAHQVVYAPGDTMFNESYATAVERLGLAQWRASGQTLAEDAAAVQRLAEFRTITRRTRAALSALYDPDAGETWSDEHKRERKAELLVAMRAEFVALKASEKSPWAGFTGYDDWLARANNASLALQAAYDGLVPDFERLFEREGRNFHRFHAAVQRLADLPKDERRATLRAGP